MSCSNEDALTTELATVPVEQPSPVPDILDVAHKQEDLTFPSEDNTANANIGENSAPAALLSIIFRLIAQLLLLLLSKLSYITLSLSGNSITKDDMICELIQKILNILQEYL